MSTSIFVNLPVSDLKKSIAFYESLGWKVNPQFSDETAACIVISPEIYVMVLTHPKFKEFIKGGISDATKATEVINALSVDSKEEVNAQLKKGLANGGTELRDPMDYGFMFNRALVDPDGHIWEFFWMDPSAIQ